MTFFECVIAIIGIVSWLTIIFWAACRIKPALLKNERIKEIYEFIVGYDVEVIEVYESD